MSESTASDISKVMNRWLSINGYLIDCQRVKPFGDDLSRFNMTIFHQRLDKQVSDRAPIESNRVEPRGCSIRSNRTGPKKVRFVSNRDKFDSTRFDSLIIALAYLDSH